MEYAEAANLLAHHPSTKGVLITMTETPRDKKDPGYSSQIDAYGYSLEHRTMCVRFKWGSSEYHYHRVGPEVAAEFAVAKSKGGFLKERIKGVYHYECTKPREDAKPA